MRRTVSMEKYFSQPKPEKDTNWVNNYAVGEDVICYTDISGEKNYYKGRVVKLNKKSVSVRFFNYDTDESDLLIHKKDVGFIKWVWRDDLGDTTKNFFKVSNLWKRGRVGSDDIIFEYGGKAYDRVSPLD